MSELASLDIAARLLAVGQLLLLLLVVGRTQIQPRTRLAAGLLFVGIAAYLLNASSALIGSTSPGRYLAQLFAQATPLFLWWFAHALFERPVDWRAASAAATVTLLTFAMLVVGGRTAEIGNLVQHGLGLGLVAHSLWIAWAGRADDLVEARRRFRLGFVFAVGLQALAILIVELALGFQPASPGLMLLQSATALALVLALGSVLLTADGDLLTRLAPAAPAPAPLSPSEAVLRDRLAAAMAAGLWLRPGLTVGQLAAELAVPEHRLRALINRRLGHRNFAAYLNGHRIAEARRRLADPKLVDLPVLTIAMDLGYGSLAPFNRAFKDETGTTPTDWRRRALAGEREQRDSK